MLKSFYVGQLYGRFLNMNHNIYNAERKRIMNSKLLMFILHHITRRKLQDNRAKRKRNIRYIEFIILRTEEEQIF